MEHKTPSIEIFNELKDAAKSVWQDNYSDEFGYVTEKLDRIKSIDNYADNAMVCYRMFDSNNQYKMRQLLSPEALEYITNNN